jgi:hypothetical protein
MKKTLAILMLLIFATGVIAVPAVHSMHCDGHGHSDNTCPICAVANLSLATANTFTAPLFYESVIENISLPSLLKAEILFFCTNSARAPPVA